jgi:hypothetical protein
MIDKHPSGLTTYTLNFDDDSSDQGARVVEHTHPNFRYA